MKRRKFIQQSGLAGLSLAFYPIFEKAASVPEEASIETLQQLMQSDKLSATELTAHYLKRIAELDQAGPLLKSVIEVNPDALSIAKQLDEERRQGKTRGPLHGIPVLIKDNIDTADKLQTTAGALAMLGNRASKDAMLVARLREAGAVLLGKTNLSEWANFRSTRSSSGWSSRGGQTRNPYAPDRSPCGSSSGSGVAVAANFCVVAIGTETDGSISCPASMNCVVGIKPTVGMVSRTGIIPISHTQDTAGPMARSVRDAALMMNVLAGSDPKDAATAFANDYRPADFTTFLKTDALKGKRIGIEKSYRHQHEGVDQLLAEALETLEKCGATVVEINYLEVLNKNGDAEFDVLKYEFKDGLNRYLRQSNAPVKNLEQVIEFNRKHEKEAMPHFKQEILESSQELGDLKSKAYLEALKKSNQATREVIKGVMEQWQLDAICGPATGAPWCIDLVNGDHWTGYGAYSPAAVAGFPSVTTPMGFLQDLPLGLCFFSRAWTDAELIGMAYAYEQASKKRVAPVF